MVSAPPQDEVRAELQRKQTIDRQRLLEQIAGLGTQQSDVPAEGLTDTDVDVAVASVGSLDAALLAAVSRGAATCQVRALLLRGASPNAAFIDSSALAIAVRSCDPGVTAALLESGAELDRKVCQACGTPQF